MHVASDPPSLFNLFFSLLLGVVVVREGSEADLFHVVTR